MNSTTTPIGHSQGSGNDCFWSAILFIIWFEVQRVNTQLHIRNPLENEPFIKPPPLPPSQEFMVFTPHTPQNLHNPPWGGYGYFSGTTQFC